MKTPRLQLIVRSLFLKRVHHEKMQAVSTLRFNESGIEHNIPCQPLRQVLIVHQGDLEELQLEPWYLRENIIVNYPSLHDLPSGSVLGIWEARIRLTFHCEPCSTVLGGPVKFSNLVHRRGVLGLFLNAGEIHLGDTVSLWNEYFEEIPYEPSVRIQWYMDRNPWVITASKLLVQIGCSSSYARAIPAWLKKLPHEYSERVIFKKDIHQSSWTKKESESLHL